MRLFLFIIVIVTAALPSASFPTPPSLVLRLLDDGGREVLEAEPDPALVRSLESARPDKSTTGKPAFEMLYEVAGTARTNLDAMLVHSAKLDYGQIWGGNFLHAEATEP